MKQKPQSSLICGYVVSFTIKKIFEENGAASFDVEISLADEWQSPSPTTIVRFSDVRELRYGDTQDGIAFGAKLSLSIDDVSANGWEGIRFRAINVEQGCLLSLYSRALEVRAA